MVLGGRAPSIAEADDSATVSKRVCHIPLNTCMYERLLECNMYTRVVSSSYMSRTLTLSPLFGTVHHRRGTLVCFLLSMSAAVHGLELL